MYMLTLLPKGVQIKLKLFWFFPSAIGVNNTGGAPWAANISTNFQKKFEMALMVYSGAWGKLLFASIFFINHLPQAPDTNIRVIYYLFENSWRYSQVKVHHCTGINKTGGKFCHQYCWYCWYRWQFATGINDNQRHWWQVMGTLSDCWYLKVNFKEKSYLYVNSTTQRCPKS